MGSLKCGRGPQNDMRVPSYKDRQKEAISDSCILGYTRGSSRQFVNEGKFSVPLQTVNNTDCHLLWLDDVNKHVHIFYKWSQPWASWNFPDCLDKCPTPSPTPSPTEADSFVSKSTISFALHRVVQCCLFVFLFRQLGAISVLF